MSQEQHIWTVAIIITHNDQYFEYSDLEQSILDQTKYENIRYIIFSYDINSRLATIKKLLFNDEQQSYQFGIIDGPEEKDIYQKDTLIDFLKSHVINPNPANNHYMVITWGHGAGLGFFSQLTKEVNKVDYFTNVDPGLNKIKEFDLLKTSINEQLNTLTYLKANLSLHNIDDIVHSLLLPLQARSPISLKVNFDKLVTQIKENLKLITAQELNEIFKAAFPESQKIDMLLTINCYTQIFDVGFMLKEKVNLLLSPQTTIPFAGINYKTLFEAIETKPTISLKEVSENVTASFRDKYDTEPFKSQFERRYPIFKQRIKEVSISGVFLSYYDELFNILNSIAVPLKDFSDNNSSNYCLAIKQEIVNARRACSDLTWNRDYGVVDFFHFLEELTKKTNIQVIEDAYSRLDSLKSNALASQLRAFSEYYIGEGTFNSSMSPFFTSVFFPFDFFSDIQSLLIDLYFHSNTGTTARANFKWDDFAEFLYKHP
jgi:hypothetical protein